MSRSLPFPSDPAEPDGDSAASAPETEAGQSAPEHGADLPESPESDPPAAIDDRRALLDLVIYAYDRTTSAGIRTRLAEGLRAAGVQVLTPDGERFDPAQHEAGGTEPTDDPDKHDTVAETELAGFVDRGTVIREPIVVVYRLT